MPGPVQILEQAFFNNKVYLHGTFYGLFKCIQEKIDQYLIPSNTLKT